MRFQFITAIFVCVFVVACGVIANGQSGPQTVEKDGGKVNKPSSSAASEGNPVLNLAGKVTVVIIKSAAKTAWETTKFAAKDVAKPIIVGIAKPLLLKISPQITMFALKLTGNSLKKGIPIATKLGMTYLRAKLPI